MMIRMEGNCVCGKWYKIKIGRTTIFLYIFILKLTPCNRSLLQKLALSWLLKIITFLLCTAKV